MPKVTAAVQDVQAAMDRLSGSGSKVSATEALAEVRDRMTRYAAHLRSGPTAARAFDEAVAQFRRIEAEGLHAGSARDILAVCQVRQQCLTHAAMLYAIREMLARGAGSRGSHCVLDPAGEPMHPKLTDPDHGEPYRVKAENEALRNHILAVRYDADAAELFTCRDDTPRPVPRRDVAFETAWREFREGRIYQL